MAGDAKMIVVTEDFCNACGTPQVNVHHKSFPELSVRGESPDEGAENLALQLKPNLDAVSDPSHRERVRRAMADVEAFLARETDPRPKISGVIDVLSDGPAQQGAPPSSLAKTEMLEVRRLTLPKGRAIPTHKALGEITVQCLEGRIAFTASGVTREVRVGQLIVLPAGEPHSLVGLEDSTLLVTKVLLHPPSSPSGRSKSESRDIPDDRE
jgi:quercetin dioxygenase-like cupin family protein